MTEIIDRLTEYAKAMKKQGHSRGTQEVAMKLIWDTVLDDVYKTES